MTQKEKHRAAQTIGSLLTDVLDKQCKLESMIKSLTRNVKKSAKDQVQVKEKVIIEAAPSPLPESLQWSAMIAAYTKATVPHPLQDTALDELRFQLIDNYNAWLALKIIPQNIPKYMDRNEFIELFDEFLRFEYEVECDRMVERGGHA